MECFREANELEGPVARVHPSVPRLFNPRTVAVVGATEKAGISRLCVSNLLGELPDLKAEVYPINPQRKTVLGAPCYPSLEACPKVPDLVLIATPAKTVPPIVASCVTLKVPVVIVISAGFKEIGPEGKALEDRISADIERGGMRTRVVGPNCMGVMDSGTKLNATFTQQLCLPGACGFVSQSGAIMCLVYDYAMKRNRGFSKLVSVGSMLDLAWAELLTYIGDDERTKVVMTYMESVGNAREFLTAARRVSLLKPIVLLKSGRTSAAAKAAVSHTGSLTGSDDVADCAFERAGVLRVDTVDELLDVSEALSLTPLPKGPRLAILTHAGGPGVLAADALCMAGGVLAELPEEVAARLDAQVPPHWSRSNPLDLTGAASPEQYQRCLDELAELPDVDGILVFCGNLAVCPATEVASVTRRFANRHRDKTLICCLMGGDDVEAGRKLLLRGSVPCFATSDAAARAFVSLWRYRQTVERLHAKVPAPKAPVDWIAYREQAALIDEKLLAVRRTGRTVLTEAESKEVLAMAGLPVAETVPAHTVDEAVAIAKRMGFPVVVKLLSETITHKSDVGGVVLDVKSEEGVRAAWNAIRTSMSAKLGADKWEAHFGGVTVQPMLDTVNSYELLLGASTDPQFGPVIAFGTGGKLVEVFRDSALVLPPLNPNLAREAIAKTKISKALKGTRGQGPVDMDALCKVVVDFGDLLSYHRMIKEADVNPLLASSSRICAVDGRIVLWAEGEKIPELAVAPFPLEGVKRTGEYTLRHARQDDEEAFVAWNNDAEHAHMFATTLGKETIDPKFLNSRARAARVLFESYDAPEMTIGAFTKEGRFAAATRFIRRENDPEERCEILIYGSVSVLETVGLELVQWTLERAKINKFHNVFWKEVKGLPEANAVLRKIVEAVGFKPSDSGFVFPL